MRGGGGWLSREGEGSGFCRPPFHGFPRMDQGCGGFGCRTVPSVCGTFLHIPCECRVRGGGWNKQLSLKGVVTRGLSGLVQGGASGGCEWSVV